jgi:large subunit ribosomal protein L25
MKEVSLKVKPREKRGKEYAKKLRRSGIIPAVVYGQQTASLPLEVESKAFHALLRHGLGENVLITLTAEDQKGKDRKVLVREVQRDPVGGDIVHIDFHEISLTKKLAIQVPIHLVGVPEGVTNGGILQHVLRELEVECLPTAIPEKIDVDVTSLDIGDSIHVADLKLEGIDVLSDPHSSIVSVVPPTVFKEPEAAPVAEAEPEVIGEKEEGEEKEEKEEKEEGKEKGKEEPKAEKKAAEGAKEEKKKEGK